MTKIGLLYLNTTFGVVCSAALSGGAIKGFATAFLGWMIGAWIGIYLMEGKA